MAVNNDNRSWKLAYDWIKEAIDSERLKTDEPLPENFLAAEIGISRTPIREALRVLAQEDYVKIIPGKGAFVSSVTLEDIKELYDIRKLLEPFASLSAVNRIPDKEIMAMEKNWTAIQKMMKEKETVDWRKVSGLDHALHFTIIKYSANKRIGAILTSYHGQIERLQYMAAQSLSDLMDTSQQHLDLLECLKERDAEKFSNNMYNHIVKSEEYILKNYFLL